MASFEAALTLLRAAIGNPMANFVDGQWEAIDALVNQRSRALVVQRTGWGKSMVYFLATKLLRDGRSGPTLIISPLLALMRNQCASAEGLGLRAETINTSNRDDWDRVVNEVQAGKVDLLLVSPERLANADFMERCLLPVAATIALLVVDEAHCISDWGHDFRPDYQRVDRIIRLLPPSVAVLATTATANDRVTADVADLLGEDAVVLRGPLARDSLQLQATNIPAQARRLAWLAAAIPRLPGSGIVYTLTVRDADQVAKWLRENNIDARAYHSRVTDGEEKADGRVELEKMLVENRVKVLVATNSLGMGFDKPDLGFVIHYQAPQSLVHYYQQVGRAGRGIDNAVGVLLGGDEDDEINRHFIEQAFPAEADVLAVVAAISDSDNGLSTAEITQRLNLRQGQIDQVLKMLLSMNSSPLVKIDNLIKRTAVAYTPDRQKIARLTGQRQAEWAQVQAYLRTTDCLMMFIASALDDVEAVPCGRCASCLGRPVMRVEAAPLAIQAAQTFTRRSNISFAPRKLWQTGAFPTYGWNGKIAVGSRTEDGRALSIWRDAGWGRLVDDGKRLGRFSDELVQACLELLRERWQPEPMPEWVTCVPSLRSVGLVPDFAQRLALNLGIPFVPAVAKVEETQRQRNMLNSWQQASNLDGAFEVEGENVLDGPVLLVDDIADSRWSLTVCGALLREAGSGPVFPLVLALTSASSA